MTQYEFEVLDEEQRGAMYRHAVHQLEAQLFEAQINLAVVPDADAPDSQTGESINDKMARLVETIARLKAAETTLIG